MFSRRRSTVGRSLNLLVHFFGLAINLGVVTINLVLKAFNLSHGLVQTGLEFGVGSILLEQIHVVDTKLFLSLRLLKPHGLNLRVFLRLEAAQARGLTTVAHHASHLLRAGLLGAVVAVAVIVVLLGLGSAAIVGRRGRHGCSVISALLHKDDLWFMSNVNRLPLCVDLRVSGTSEAREKSHRKGKTKM